LPGPFCFAWAGGTLAEQQTVVTTGATHGGVVQSVALVGDIEAAGVQVRNLASTGGLTAGDYYALTAGPGIAEGTTFIFDDNEAISGAPGSLNLSQPTGATLRSVTLTAVKSTEVGNPVVTVSAGSDVVEADLALDPDRYAITGFGMDADGIAVATAFLDWDGASGIMWLPITTSSRIEDDDQFGQPITRTVYTTTPTSVVATASGDVPAIISGLPSGDWYSVTNIPAAALSSLTPGLRYNIAGNGIQTGSTFVAPDPGATAITLDLPASSSDLNALLTITGPRTPNEDFDPAAHNRFDEEIVGLDISHDEGGFATLTIDLRNPAVGLLAVGRNLWCWLSWDAAWTPDGGAPPDLVPLFNGRLIGVPRLQAGEIVQLQFLARPDDFNAQKAALTEALQVPPYYDPVWLAANVGPDTVLETYSALWHIDRVSLALTVSDIIQGEDGIVDIGEDLALYDHFSLAYGQPPLVSATVSGTVSWQQQAEGIIDITRKVAQAFDAAGAAPFGLGFPILHQRGPRSPGSGGGALIQGLSDGLMSDWPKGGSSIGGGWSFTARTDPTGLPLNYITEASANNKGGWISPVNYRVRWAGPTPTAADENPLAGHSSNVQIMGTPANSLTANFPITTYKIRTNIEYRADRKRTETVAAVMVADVQRELSDSADADREEITLTSEYVAQGIDPGGGVPIGDLSYKSYFQTARGQSSFEYLLLAARAKIRARARAVDITFAVKWTDAIGLGLDLRKSVALTDRRLPGGSAAGKVKSYKLTVADGRMLGEFTIGATIGNGTPSEAADGSNAYVDAGYTDDYQVVAGGQLQLLDDELAYEPLDAFAIHDDGLDLAFLTADIAVNYCIVTNGLDVQLTELSSFQGSVAPNMHGDPMTAARELTTTVVLDLKPVTGAEFHTDFYPAVSQLSLPKTIDLAAESG